MASSPGGRARIGTLLALVMVAASACTSGGRGGGRTAAVRFDQRGGDVFAWSGRISGSGDCAEVTLLVNGRPVPAATNVPVTDGRFSAAVPLGGGRNEIAGRCAGGEPTHYFDWEHLPNLDYGNPEVRRMIAEAFSYWVRDLGIDGFRVDAAWGVQRRRPDFWPGLRRELKRIDPDILLLAEGSATDPYFFSHGFDVAYDWTDEPGHWAWGSVFGFPQEIRSLLAAAITNEPKGYAPNAIVMRFLNNNDTDVRFVDRHGPGFTRVAATLQFTVPGIPQLFAGDEIGASYQPYSNLTPIPWEDRHGLRPLYERLIDLKHRIPALNTRGLDLVASTPGSSFAYLRPAPASGGAPVLVVLNFGGPATVELTRTKRLDAALNGRGTMRDLLTDRPVRLGVGPRTVTIRMGAESAHVLAPGAD